MINITLTVIKVNTTLYIEWITYCFIGAFTEPLGLKNWLWDIRNFLTAFQYFQHNGLVKYVIKVHSLHLEIWVREQSHCSVKWEPHLCSLIDANFFHPFTSGGNHCSRHFLLYYRCIDDHKCDSIWLSFTSYLTVISWNNSDKCGLIMWILIRSLTQLAGGFSCKNWGRGRVMFMITYLTNEHNFL